MSNYCKNCYELTEQLDQLKVENEELKKAYARLNALYNDNCNFTGKLEETLAEIKEFVENEMTSNCDTYIILQKINEVENEKM